MVAVGLFFLWDRVWLRAIGVFAVLCAAITFHAVFNVLVSRPGVICRIGSAVPLTMLLSGLILLRGKVDFSWSIFEFQYFLIKAPKVIVTTQACLWWGQGLWAHPYTSMKWGRGPTKCECGVGLWECEARNNPYLIKMWLLASESFLCSSEKNSKSG